MEKMKNIFNFMVKHARDQKRTKGMGFPLKRDLMNDLIDAAIITLMNDPILLEVSPPITLFGDLHGQIDDLLGWFDWIGWPPKLRLLCLGEPYLLFRFSSLIFFIYSFKAITLIEAITV